MWSSFTRIQISYVMVDIIFSDPSRPASRQAGRQAGRRVEESQCAGAQVYKSRAEWNGAGDPCRRQKTLD